MCPPYPQRDRCWLVVFRINVDLAIFQPYLDLEAGDNQSLKIQVARPIIEPRSSCSASQELNHSATAAPSQRDRKRRLNGAVLVFFCVVVTLLFNFLLVKSLRYRFFKPIQAPPPITRDAGG